MTKINLNDLSRLVVSHSSAPSPDAKLDIAKKIRLIRCWQDDARFFKKDRHQTAFLIHTYGQVVDWWMSTENIVLRYLRILKKLEGT